MVPGDIYVDLWGGFFNLSQDSRKRIISLGFDLLKLEEHNGINGYFLATSLGTFLKIPGEFKPDSKDPQYKGENGLTEKFFSDTVKNALEYWRINSGSK
jgi:hypothetical protein